MTEAELKPSDGSFMSTHTFSNIILSLLSEKKIYHSLVENVLSNSISATVQKVYVGHIISRYGGFRPGSFGASHKLIKGFTFSALSRDYSKNESA